DVDHAVVAGGGGEDPVQLWAAGGVGGSAAEQEAELERPHSGLAGEPECLFGALGVLGAGRDPQSGPDPVVRLGGLDHQLVEGEGDRGIGDAVVGDDQGAFGALRVQVGDQLLD